MNPVLNKQQQADILKALDTAIAVDVWSKSSTLRVIGKRLTSIRDNFQQAITGAQPELKTNEKSTQTNETDKIQVFVSLYSSTGDDLRSWERILSTLPKQIVSRPIYAKEQDAEGLLRSSPKRQNEAYLCLWIDSAQIQSISEEKLPRDRSGHPLLTLKGRAMSADYEATFVHLSGRYRYANGKLAKVSEPSI